MSNKKHFKLSIFNYAPLQMGRIEGANYFQKLIKHTPPFLLLSYLVPLLGLLYLLFPSDKSIDTVILVISVSFSCAFIATVVSFIRKKTIASQNSIHAATTGLMETIASPVVLLNSAGRIVMASTYFYDTFNVDKKNVVDHFLNKYLKENYPGDFDTWLKNPVATYSVKFTIDQYHNSGEISIIPHPYKASNQLYYFATIKLSKTFEDEVSKYQDFIDRYKALTSSSRNVVWDYNFETGESYYNDSIFKIFGYPAYEIKGNKHWWAGNIHPDDRNRVITHIDKCIAENYLIWTDEYRFRCANGEYKIVDDHGLIQRDTTGKPYRLLGFMNDITEQKVLQKQLKEEQLLFKTELAKAISDAQENERKNISEELHDNVCQVLGGVKLFLDHCILSETKNDELLRQSSGYLNDVIRELRKMAHVLSPYSVEKFGLLSALRELVYFATNFRKASVNLETSNFDESILSGYKKLLLYRVVQEQLNNILKHSNATQIEIEINNIGNTCFFLIADDGEGMSFSEDKIGFGLKNIQHRVELLNGSVQFITSPGNGFQMHIEFEAT